MLTDTEFRLLAALSGGEAVPIEALVPCLLDGDLGDRSCVRVHLCRLRSKVEPFGLRISTLRSGRSTFYILTGVKIS